jgi:YD repeat-containing protein
LATVTDPSGTTTYTWNARNQLVSLNGPNVTANFQHDALGRRLSKTINSTTTEFLYDGLNAVQELSGGNVVANLLTSLKPESTGNRAGLQT